MIKNIEDLKKIQIVCRNQEQVKDCLDYLKQLGFDVEDFTDYYDGCNIVFWGKYSEKFVFSDILSRNFIIEFYNKELVKTLQKFIKQKEEKEKEKKEKIEDIEVASDGRVIKINNWDSDKHLYFIVRWDYINTHFDRKDIEYYVNLGLAFISRKARDKAKFKMEIETKLKNIAERLNKGRKFDWEDKNQNKYEIYYDYIRKKIECRAFCYCKDQGVIYCLDKNFLEIAKQEIGEDNLIKYFKD